MLAQLDKLYLTLGFKKIYTRLVSYFFFEGRPLTTKGRWINPLVIFLLRLFSQLPLNNKIQGPIYIVGTGRSGTTILGVVLSAHKQLGFLNEPKAIWYVVCQNEDLVGNYTARPAEYRLDSSYVSTQMKEKFNNIYSFYLFITGAKRVLDKYPELVFRYSFVRKLFPKAKFLFLVRDGWDTCRSIDLWSRRLGTDHGEQRHDWWGVDNRKWKLLVSQVLRPDPYYTSVMEHIDEINSHLDMAALEWIASMREGLDIAKQNPDTVMTVYYEKLVQHPDKTMKEVFDFLELPSDEKCLQYARETLRPKSREEEKPTLHPSLLPLFQDTMQRLGYRVD